jgi:tetratricopeptide (TPR) repeat protein
MRLGILVPIAALVALAGPAAAQHAHTLGKVHFPTSCAPAVEAEFDRGVALLHSFWLDAAIETFEKVARADPGCGIAHWGVAMAAYGNPFAWPPSPKAMADGTAAIERARTAPGRTARERDYVAALAAFYQDHDKVDHRTRAVAYEKAMEQLASRYPDDREASVFYAIVLNATALPTDKTYAQQLRAAAMLERVFAEQPDHPGVAHYLIHSYDYPAIAEKGLPAARRYASIAPAAPHAQHMPSHIFTRRGYWPDSIKSNLVSAGAARSHFDVFHAWDYLAYAYLQQAQDRQARGVVDTMLGVTKPNLDHWVVAFAAATIPARYALERGQWAEAARLQLPAIELSWSRFPQTEANLVFARGVGAARSGDPAAARRDVARLEALRDALTAAKSPYWADQADIQATVVSGWVARSEGRNEEALRLLRIAAQREDATGKHPVTPGPLAPGRELLGELLLELGQPAAALAEFEASHQVEPDRFRGLHGAARAAELAGDRVKARTFVRD